MKHWKGLSKGRLVIGGATLAVAVAGGSFFARDSHAAFTVCVTDPTVTLSNGAQITMDASMQIKLSDLKSADFELHMPVGTSITGVSYDQYGSLESVKVYADQAPGMYKAVTTVDTSGGGNSALITAFGNVGGITCKQPPKSQTGLAGQPITIAFSC